MTKTANTNDRPRSAESLAVVMLSSLILFIFGGQLLYNAHFHSASSNWEMVPAEVTRIENSLKSASLIYQYSYDGEVYAGDRYRHFSSGTLNDKREINEGFQIGDKIIILVDPLNPSRSVAHRYPVRFEQVTTQILIIGITLTGTSFYFIRRWSKTSKACQESVNASCC